MKKIKLILLTIVLCLTTLITVAQTPSNTCAGLGAGNQWVINGGCLAMNTTAASTPDYNPVTCNSGNRDDAWAQIVGNGQKITITYTSAQDGILHIFDKTAGCGASLILIGCSDNFVSGGTETVTFFGEVGVVYAIRVQMWNSNSDMTGSLCVTSVAALSGDYCRNAISVTPTNTCGYITYSNVGMVSSPSGTPLPTCGNGTTAEDIWFKFTTDATGRIAVDLRPGTITDSGMEIYSGSCGGLTSVGCADDKGTATYPNYRMSRLQGTLTPLTQYYIRVWKYGGGTGTFEMCVRNLSVLVEDVCSTAPTLALSTVYPKTNWWTTPNTTTDPTTTPTCNGSVDNSVWFKFTTTIAGNYTIDLTNIQCSQGTGPQVDVGKWSGSSCVSLNWVSNVCANPKSCNNLTLVANSLLASTTYYIFVDGWGSQEEDFDFNLKITPPTSLPIELISFSGEKSGFNNELSWLTASEFNNDYYTIEKTTDGFYFEVVGIENGAGNSSQYLNYNMIDGRVQPIINYYRLKQTDYDGKYVYSDLISIDNRVNDKKILRIINILGQEVDDNYIGVKIYYFTDGSFVRKI